MNDMVIHQSNQLTARDIRANVNLVQEVMREVMKDNVHYGVIPGTKKPTLYKSGAEVLCVTFRVADIYVTEDLSTPDCFRYRVICSGIHQTTGFTLGSGVGECSSDEDKYKWRKPVHNNEYEAVPENRRRLKYNKDGGTWKQVRTEPADLANTILKMAAKRAKIAMTLNVTAASDCFTQDIEDLPEEMRGDDESNAAANAVIAELRERLLNLVPSCADKDALTALWNSGVAQIKPTGDKPLYDAFKAAIGARGKVLADIPKVEKPVVDDPFVREMEAAEATQ